MSKKEEIVKNLKQTLQTVRGFNSNTPEKAELNYKVVGKVIEEFSEALLYLLGEEIPIKEPNIMELLPKNEKGS